LKIPFLSNVPVGRAQSLLVLGSGPVLGIKPELIISYQEYFLELHLQEFILCLHIF
jgi:hypothetical protein